MYNFKVSKKYKIPEFRTNKKSTRIYHLERMKVGHSFIYTGSVHGATSLMWQYRKKLGHDYVSVVTSYGNRRIWRVT